MGVVVLETPVQCVLGQVFKTRFVGGPKNLLKHFSVLLKPTTTCATRIQITN